MNIETLVRITTNDDKHRLPLEQPDVAAAQQLDAQASKRLLFAVHFFTKALRRLAIPLDRQFHYPQQRPPAPRFSQHVSLLFFLGLVFWQMPEVQRTQKSIYWGSLIDGGTYGGQDAPWDMSTLESFEENAGKQISILHWGQAWWHCDKTCDYQHFRHQRPQYEQMRQRGVIPLIDWASWTSAAQPVTDQPQFSLQTILDGKHDAYIRQWASEAKAWGYPFFLRFNWEMNGNWFPWSERVDNNQPGQYVQAWRHVHDIFRDVGATNVTWVWCPNAIYSGSIPLTTLYPGDEYVDWTCMDGYNWGTHPSKPDRWKSFEELFSPTYAELLKLGRDKPIIIGETASTETGGSKPEWITKALSQDLPDKLPRVEAILWFNWNVGGMDWIIESSEASNVAFADAIASNYFTSDGSNLTVGTPIQPRDSTPLLCLFGMCLFLPNIVTQ